MSSLTNEKFNSALQKGRRIRRIKEWAVFSGYLTPSLLGVSIFFFIPLIIILVKSFQKSVISTDFVGLDNYIDVLSNKAFLLATKNTLIFSAIAVPLAIVLGLLLAILLNSKIPKKSFFRSALLSPLIVPVASIVLIWQVIFSYSGSLNSFLGNFGIDKIDWMKSDASIVVILLLFLWKNLGYNMVLFLCGLNGVPKELLESAKMDGAGRIKRFFAISMPYLYPTIFFVGIMSLVNSFKVFREIYLLTGSYPYDSLYMLQHFMNNAFQNLDYQKLFPAAIVMCIAMVIIVGILFFFESKLSERVEE